MAKRTTQKIITALLISGFLTTAGAADSLLANSIQPNPAGPTKSYRGTARPIVFPENIELRGRVFGETETYLAVKLTDGSLIQLPKDEVSIRAEFTLPRRNDLIGHNVVFPLRSNEVYYLIEDNGQSVKLSGQYGTLVLPRKLVARFTPDLVEDPSKPTLDSQRLEYTRYLNQAL